MEKEADKENCRACITQRRSLKSIFHKAIDNHSYADLLAMLANVKVKPCDGFSKKICSICRRKAEDAYDFQILVQKSDCELRGKEFHSLISPNKLIFGDISEVKLEIDVIKQEYKVNHSNETPDTGIPELEKIHFEDEVAFNDVMIKKCIKTETKDIGFDVIADNGIDFKIPELPLASQDETGDNHYSDDNNCNNDDDYDIKNNKEEKKSQPTRAKKKKRKNSDEDFDPKLTPCVRKKIIENEKKLKILGKAEKPRGRPRKAETERQREYREKYAGAMLLPVVRDDLVEESQHSRTHKPPMPEKLPLLMPRVIKGIQVAHEPHITRHHMRKKKQNKIKSSICPHCGKTFKSLDSHILIHTQGKAEFKCDQCPKAFYTQIRLKGHLVSHSGERKFQCDKCPMRFYNKGLLKSHMLCHEEVKNFVCEVCSKAFKRANNCRSHMLRHSSANKIIKCDHCNMTFFEKQFLRHHMRIHTGERPFKCELCSQPYSYKAEYNRHCFKKHGVFMKWRSDKIMNQALLDKERVAVRAMLDSNPDISLPTPERTFPRIMDTKQLAVLFGTASLLV